MRHLSEERLDEVYNAALGVGLVSSRSALLAGLDPGYVTSLPHHDQPAAQVYGDLSVMNGTEPLSDGSNPIRLWLRNAKRLAGPRQQARVFDQALGDLEAIVLPPVMKTENRRPSQVHPFDELPLRFEQPAVRQLLDILIDAYPDEGSIMVLVRNSGISLRGLARSPMLDVFWQNVLSAARKQEALRSLVEETLKDVTIRAYHDRLKGLLSPSPVLLSEGQDAKTIIAWRPQAPQTAERKERIIGANSTLLGIGFLEKGLRHSPAIVRLEVDYGSSKAVGTGFLIEPDLLLTNHHVLFDENGGGAAAVGVSVWFHYELDLDGKPKPVDSYEGDPSTIKGNRDLDWAIVRLREPPSQKYAPVPFKAPSRPVAVGNRVYIIQHPRGTFKQIGMHHNEVVSIDDRVIQYLTDTEAGSSGAPVFNENWELVALHHQWVTTTQADGTTEYRNEGIRVESILASLSKEGSKH